MRINVKKIGVLLIILTVAITITVTGCFGGDPENVLVSIDSPPSVQLGDEFIIRFIVQNTANREQSIVSLDVDNSYFEGIYINEIVPESSEVYELGLVDMLCHSFDIAVPPGESREVLFYATALQAGDFQGDVDFCINRDSSFLTKSIRTVVTNSQGSKK